jgi:hypothetical protein
MHARTRARTRARTLHGFQHGEALVEGPRPLHVGQRRHAAQHLLGRAHVLHAPARGGDEVTQRRAGVSEREANADGDGGGRRLPSAHAHVGARLVQRDGDVRRGVRLHGVLVGQVRLAAQAVHGLPAAARAARGGGRRAVAARRGRGNGVVPNEARPRREILPARRLHCVLQHRARGEGLQRGKRGRGSGRREEVWRRRARVPPAVRHAARRAAAHNTMLGQWVGRAIAGRAPRSLRVCVRRGVARQRAPQRARTGSQRRLALACPPGRLRARAKPRRRHPPLCPLTVPTCASCH